MPFREKISSAHTHLLARHVHPCSLEGPEIAVASGTCHLETGRHLLYQYALRVAAQDLDDAPEPHETRLFVLPGTAAGYLPDHDPGLAARDFASQENQRGYSITLSMVQNNPLVPIFVETRIFTNIAAMKLFAQCSNGLKRLVHLCVFLRRSAVPGEMCSVQGAAHSVHTGSFAVVLSRG